MAKIIPGPTLYATSLLAAGGVVDETTCGELMARATWQIGAVRDDVTS